MVAALGCGITGIHQILPDMVFGDAISNQALEIRDILRCWGYEANIYAMRIHPRMRKYASIYREYIHVSSKENILLFHFSIGSNLSEFIKNLPDKKILIYHNVTPANYFVGINDELAYLLRRGRKELEGFCNIIDLALCDSEYNRRELAALGFKKTRVLPIIIDFRKYDQKPEKKILNMFRDNYTNYIFVGRISPNKKQEDVIKIFYYINRYINSASRLFLIGSYEGTEKYYEKLKRLTKQLGLENNVYLTGRLEFNQLLAYYKSADVFLSMSEHEGFCVPLIESMYFKIPIIAYNSTAVPDTMGGAGILVNDKNYQEIAEMASLLAEDSSLRRRIIAVQDERLRDFDKSHAEALLKSYLNEVS